MQNRRGTTKDLLPLLVFVAGEMPWIWSAVGASAPNESDLLQLIVLAICGVGGLLLGAGWVAFTRENPLATSTGALVHGIAVWIVFYIAVSCLLYAGVRVGLSL